MGMFTFPQLLALAKYTLTEVFLPVWMCMVLVSFIVNQFIVSNNNMPSEVWFFTHCQGPICFYKWVTLASVSRWLPQEESFQ